MRPTNPSFVSGTASELNRVTTEPGTENYALGHSPTEIRRLGIQAAIIQPITSNKCCLTVGPKADAPRMRTGAEVHCTGKRSEYDVKYGLPASGDDVELTVAVEGVRK